MVRFMGMMYVFNMYQNKMVDVPAPAQHVYLPPLTERGVDRGRTQDGYLERMLSGALKGPQARTLYTNTRGTNGPYQPLSKGLGQTTLPGMQYDSRIGREYGIQCSGSGKIADFGYQLR